MALPTLKKIQEHLKQAQKEVAMQEDWKPKTPAVAATPTPPPPTQTPASSTGPSNFGMGKQIAYINQKIKELPPPPPKPIITRGQIKSTQAYYDYLNGKITKEQYEAINKELTTVK